MQQQTMNHHIKDNDEDEMYSNPNLHPEEQDELELPDKYNSRYPKVYIRNFKTSRHPADNFMRQKK
ncbi:hypothetical protein RhiirB3_455427 [Rhizophagus irregularis]|nr:hypothetical protein RhiirB3_455427 [Rhizophagus irregularis]